MDYNELIVDINEIPLDRHLREDNLELLLKHAEYLKTKNGIKDEDTKYLVTHASDYIRMQVDRMKIHIEAEIDIIAWISRGLMELYFVLRYVYNSPDRLDEINKEHLKDWKEIENIISKRILTSDTPEIIHSFKNTVEKSWGKLGVNRSELEGPERAYFFAKEAKLEDEYLSNYKIHSKYVHTTAYLLFGNRKIIDGSNFRRYFWQHAQFYAAQNLSDLHKLIKASNNN